MDLLEYFVKIGVKDEASDKVGGIQQKFSKGLGTIAKVGAAAVGAATAAVGAFAVTSLKVGAEFDTAMSQVAATSGKTMQQLNDDVHTVMAGNEQFTGNLREFAEYLGSTTAFSATQAAEALNYMALAGYDAQTSMEVLPSVLDLAAAGGLELGTASDMVTDALSALGLGASDAEGFVDVLAKTSSSSNTSVAQLGEAILTVGANAKDMAGGMVQLKDGTTVATSSTTELATALGLMANVGIKGSEGGTHLRNILLSLEAPTGKSAKLLRELGVNVFDTDGNMRNLNDIMVDLNSSMDHLSAKERTNAISKIFNKTDIAAASALLDSAGESWDELALKIEESGGAASQMAATQLDNLNGSVTLFKSALEGLQITVSEALSPTLKEFVDFGSSAVSAITEGFKTGDVKGAMNEVGKAAEQLLGMLVEQIPEFLNAGMELLGALAEGLIENLPMLLDAAIDIVMQLADGFIAGFPQLMAAAGEAIVTISQTLVQRAPEIGVKAGELIIAFVGGIVNALPQVFEAAVNIIVSICEALDGALGQVVAKGLEIIMKVVEGIGSGLSEAAREGREIIETVKNGIMEKISEARQWGADLIKNFIGGIKDAAGKLGSVVADVAGNIAGFFHHSVPKYGPFKDELTWMPDFMSNMANGIKDNAYLVQDALDKSFDFGGAEYDVSVNGSQSAALGRLLALAEEYLPRIGDSSIVLDTGALVGQTVGHFDRALGNLQKQKQRGYALT